MHAFVYAVTRYPTPSSLLEKGSVQETCKIVLVAVLFLIARKNVEKTPRKNVELLK